MGANVALQTAIYTLLAADGPLNAIIVGVYDEVPQAAESEDNTAYPFIVIGDDQLQPWNTDTELGFDATVSVVIYSRYRGRLEIKQIADALYDALNRVDLVVTGYQVLDCVVDNAGVDFSVLQDGVTRRGDFQFNVKFEV